MKKIAVVGSFMTDLIITADRFVKEGETLIGTSFGQFPGGKGANQAVAAARLGAPVTMIGKLGRDAFGDEQIASMEANHVDHSHVLFSDDHHSGVGNPQIDGQGRNRIVVVPGANMDFTPAEIDNLAATIAANDIILLQLEIPIQTIYQTIRIAHRLGKTVIVNPAPAQPLDADYAGWIDWIAPNEHEAQALTGIPVHGFTDAQRAAKKLLDLGYRNVLITLGQQGALAATADGTSCRVDAFPVTAIDSVGAGDAYIGTFAYALANDWSVEAAMGFAAADAAISVTRHGCQPSLPTTTEVRSFLHAHRNTQETHTGSTQPTLHRKPSEV